MGDSEDTLPSCKKRLVARELSRDNPNLDDQDDVSEQETGTFKKASDDVLANRRIVEVGQSQTSSSPSVPSSNPSAAIRLIPPTDSTPVPATTSNEIESETNVNKETEKGQNDGNQQPETKEKIENEAKKDTEINEKNENHEKNTEMNSEPASVNSFQQLSSSQNAFTGLSGTGFSNSTFSCGPIFGTNGNTSLFSNPITSVANNIKRTKTPSLQEVPIETGEENEHTVFTADSMLFEFLDGGWKERGKGELKVNVSTTGTRKPRLVMRSRGNYRLILNASLFPDMKLTNMEKKGITFACLNGTGEEGQDGLSTFALKFKDALIVDEFRSVVTRHKDHTTSNDPTL